MTDKAITQERDKILRSGRLHAVHYAAVAFSFLMTFAVWQYSTRQVAAQTQAAFDRSTSQIVELIVERMHKYEEALRAGVAVMRVRGGDLTHSEWQTFARNLKIDTKYPGINGIGVIKNIPTLSVDAFLRSERRTRPDFRIHPPHEKDLHLPIVYIEPEAPNRQAMGLDMAFEINRLTGILAARDTGLARITGPIRLVQDEGATAGFLFFTPFYNQDVIVTPENRQSHFRGAVYAPFVVRKLMEGVLAAEKRDLRVRINDRDQIIYNELAADDPLLDPDPMLTRRVGLDLYGRTWMFDIHTNLAFRAAHTRSQPTIILVCGIIIDIFLLTLFLLLTRSNRRAVAFADRLNEALQKEKRELQDSNAALEQYAYVSSHDLKTPIRSMRDLTEYLVEDLEEVYPDVRGEPSFERNITQMQALIARMDDLVKGVLEYSQIGQSPAQVTTFSSEAAFATILGDLAIPVSRVRMVGDLPELRFDPVLFAQIFSNLIANAMAHHDRPDAARITLTGRSAGADLVIDVTDNGPGIAPESHAKIFEMFQSLRVNSPRKTTGIGLAIVKRAVERAGGSITLTSAPGHGSTFTVTLPDSVAFPKSQMAAE